MAQLELVAGGEFSLYVAPESEAQPLIDANEATLTGGNWSLVGTNGSDNMDEGGITVRHPLTTEEFYGLGDTEPLESFVTRSGAEIEVVLHDLSAVVYALALGDLTISDVAAGSGTAGYQEFAPTRAAGRTPTVAALLRWPSSLLADTFGQFWIPRVAIVGSPEPVFVKGVPAGVQLLLRRLKDNTQSAGDEYGFITQQDAAAI